MLLINNSKTVVSDKSLAISEIGGYSFGVKGLTDGDNVAWAKDDNILSIDAARLLGVSHLSVCHHFCYILIHEKFLKLGHSITTDERSRFTIRATQGGYIRYSKFPIICEFIKNFLFLCTCVS